ncbi:LLM class F420-dependent oxidoreductase [Actinomadura rugatobispora]|uniref:LLM class F420-dependent oxidoreductase n=1 Tax=Actinomadura rugatobispora TaxID=1994 RepID=A0ABW0ZUD2_9ACTN|nr:LLM class F420-dependent oxidoreductase [Actinomadura rugatobispora]
MSLSGADESLDQVGGLVEQFTAAGYRELWTSELTGSDAFAPLLAAAAGRPWLRLGTAVAGVFTRSPGLLAMQSLSLAEASAHPVFVGIGASSQAMVTGWHGVPYAKPYTRVRDTARFLRRAFEGDRVTFRSDSFDIDGFRLARTPPRRPRVLIAALRERMLRLAGAEADGVVLNWLSPGDVQRVAPLVLDGDPDADIVARLFVVAAADRQAARDHARRFVTGYLTSGVYAAHQVWLGRGPALEPMWRAWQAGDRKAALAAVPDHLVDDLFLTGDEAQVRAGVADYIAAGVTRPVISVVGPDPDLARGLLLRLGAAVDAAPGPAHNNQLIGGKRGRRPAR